jgi:hypothetical protein
MPIGQEDGVTSSARDCSISSNRSNGSRSSRSSLLTNVMIGTSRNRHTSKSLRVCSSMPPLVPLGRRRTPSPRGRPRSGCVGVLAEILVARRVEEVEGEPLMLEAHHRRADRDAARALDRPPIRAPAAARRALSLRPPAESPRQTAAVSRSGWSCGRPDRGPALTNPLQGDSYLRCCTQRTLRLSIG